MNQSGVLLLIFPKIWVCVGITFILDGSMEAEQPVTDNDLFV